MAGLLDFLFQGQNGGGLLGNGQPVPQGGPQLPNQPMPGLLGGLQGALNQIANPQMPQQNFQNQLALEHLNLQKQQANKPQWGVTGEGLLGDKGYGFIDTNKQTVTAPTNAPQTGNSSAMVMGPDGTPLRGEDLQAHLDRTQPAIGAAVRSIREGNENAAGRNLQKLLPIVSLVEPGFTQQDYMTRLGVMKSFKSGPDAAGLKASNQAIAHADYANSLIDKLGNSSILPGIINPLVQGFKNNSGNEDFQRTKTEYQNAVNALSGELTKVFRGNSGALADVQHWRETSGVADSPASMHANISSAMKLLNGGLEAYAEKYNNGMRSNKQPIEFLSPNNQATFNRLTGNPSAATPQAQQPQAMQPQGGGGQISSKAQYDALPSGTRFVAPDGSTRIKP